jgi:hypothetical protein
MRTIIFKKIQGLSTTKKAIVILILIMFLGAGLRFYNLGNNSFVADEFLDMNAAYGYSQTNVWQAWDFNQGAVDTIDPFAPRDERAWMYKWQVAQLFKHFAPTEQTARTVSVLWGLLSIILIYFVAKSFTKNKTIALIAAFLFAVSVTGIEFDRKLRMYAMFFPVYLTMSWLAFQFFETQYQGKIAWLKKLSARIDMQPLMIVPLLLVAALSFHLQLLSANIAPAFFIYVLLSAGWFVYRRKSYLNKYSIVTTFIIIATFGAWIVAPQILGIFIASLKFFVGNSAYFIKIFADYSYALLAALVLLGGIFWLAKPMKRPREALWLATSLFVPLIMAAFLWKRPQGIQYVFFIQSFLIILIATGIFGLAQFLRDNFSKFQKQMYFAAITLLLLLLPNYGYFFSSDNTTYHRDISQVADYRKVFVYLNKHIQSNDLLITRNFRNYYFSGKNYNVFNFGGERATADLSLETLQSLIQRNPTGWIVLFDNDNLFIAKDALQFAQKNLPSVDVSAVRGASKAYFWGNVK